MIARGVGRTVFLVGRVAIKVPSFRHGTRYFVMGMLSNMNERERWLLCKHPSLMPVYLCAPFGLLAVQKRCREPLGRLLTKDEVARLPFIGYDNNGHNAGLEGDRVVLFDYGNSDMYLVVA